MMSREGARGQEYNAWSGDGGNPPEHETILFFTRLLAGPMDFTPGIFDILIERGTGRPRRPERSEEHTSELQSLAYLVCRLLLEKKKKKRTKHDHPQTRLGPYGQ